MATARRQRSKAADAGQCLRLFRRLLATKHDDGKQRSCQNRTNNSQYVGVHSSFLLFCSGQILFIMGSNSRMTLMIIGPTVTTKSVGRIQKKIGKISFTPSFAAFSSATCRACTRI